MHLKDDKNNEYNNYDKLFITIPSHQILEMNIDLEPKTKQILEKVVYDSIATLICYKDAKIEMKSRYYKKSIFFLKK